jgi:hypothetical protein
MIKLDANKMAISFGFKKVSLQTNVILIILGDRYLPLISTVNMKYFKDLACGAKKALT